MSSLICDSNWYLTIVMAVQGYFPKSTVGKNSHLTYFFKEYATHHISLNINKKILKLVIIELR